MTHCQSMTHVTGAIDKGMVALTKADKVAGGVQGAVSQVKSGNYMGGAEALRGAAKTAGAVLEPERPPC